MGFGARLVAAWRCFVVLLFKGELPADILDYFRPPLAPLAAPATREDVGDRAVQLLAILQRDGRLVDFLQEDLSGVADAQVGAAVRDVHARCRESLAKYLTLEPVLSDAEGTRVQLAPSTDPARVKLLGAVSSTGAHHGVVQHRGWRVVHIELPPLPSAAGREIVAPAEIEVG